MVIHGYRADGESGLPPGWEPHIPADSVRCPFHFKSHNLGTTINDASKLVDNLVVEAANTLCEFLLTQLPPEPVWDFYLRGQTSFIPGSNTKAGYLLLLGLHCSRARRGGLESGTVRLPAETLNQH